MDSAQFGQYRDEAAGGVGLVVAAAAQEQRGKSVASQLPHAADVRGRRQIEGAQWVVNEAVGSTLANNRFRAEALHYFVDNPNKRQSTL